MSPARPKYCVSCGAELPPEGDFCESCGTLIQPTPIETAPEPEVPLNQSTPLREPSAAGLPDTGVPARVGRALSVGWDMLSQDVVGGVLVALVFILIAIALGVVMSFLNFLVIMPLQVGFLGWAEARRRGEPSGLDVLFRVTGGRFLDGLLLGVLVFAISLVWVVPAMFAYLGIVGWAMMLPTFAHPGGFGAGGQPPFAMHFSTVVLAFLVGWAAIFALIFGPLLQSLSMLTGWAIAGGNAFKDSISWAWERLKRDFFGWWWAGVVLQFIGGIGAILCYVGVLLTMPWAMLAWAEAAGYMGEDAELI